MRDATSPVPGGAGPVGRPAVWWRLPHLEVGHVIYATITLITALLVYEVTDTAPRADAAMAVVLGPLLALYVAHLFSAGMNEHVEQGRVLTRQQWARLALQEAALVVVAVPPAALLLVGRVLDLPASDVLRWVVWLGVASLGFWSGLAAHRAGLRRWRVLAAVLVGLLVGLIVLSVQLALKPH